MVPAGFFHAQGGVQICASLIEEQRDIGLWKTHHSNPQQAVILFDAT
jgi:hypothetical protein